MLGEQVKALLDPRAEGNREALRILLNARTVMERQSTADRLMLTSMLRTMDLGIDARHALTDEQVLAVSRWRACRDDDLSTKIARAEARRLATAICHFHAQLAANHKQLQQVVGLLAAGLLDLFGVGHVSAAQILVSYSHHGRVHSEAAFAALAGVNPIPASSGNKIRHRLNRYGDRQLNKAIHTIARSRMSSDPTTIAYVERRTAEGKTLREIRRCIKRFIARQLFRQLPDLLT